MTGALRAVVWDVDGVLIDSEPLHFDNIVRTCRRYGYRFSDRDCRESLGISLAEMWRRMPGLRGMGVTFEAFLAELVELYVGRVHGGMARVPAPAIVARLAGRGVPQAAASSSPKAIVDANVAAVGVDRYLAAWLAREDAAEAKPAPDLYLAAAARLGVAPSRCLAVEDTENGLAAAKAAGMTVVAWPHAMTADMDFSRADHVVDDLGTFPWHTVGASAGGGA